MYNNTRYILSWWWLRIFVQLESRMMIRIIIIMSIEKTSFARNIIDSSRADWSILLNDSDVCIMMLYSGDRHYSNDDSGDFYNTSTDVDIYFDFAPLNWSYMLWSYRKLATHNEIIWDIQRFRRLCMSVELDEVEFLSWILD